MCMSYWRPFAVSQGKEPTGNYQEQYQNITIMSVRVPTLAHIFIETALQSFTFAGAHQIDLH